MKSFTAVAALALAGLLALPATAEAGKNQQKNMRLVGLDKIQGRSIYRGHIQEQDGRYIAYIGHHGGPEAFNPLTGDFELNGVSIVDVTDPTNPVYLKHLKPTPPGNQSRNIQTFAGADPPGGPAGNSSMIRELGGAPDGQPLCAITSPTGPQSLRPHHTPNATPTNRGGCSTGIAYLTSNIDGWNARVLSIFDISDPENFDPEDDFIRNYIGLPGAQPGADPAGRRMTSIHAAPYLDGKVYMSYSC